MHEDALHLPVGSGPLDHCDLRVGENVFVDGKARLVEHRCGGDLLALYARQDSIRHRRQPNISIEADLMARMPRDHGTAARLRNITYEQTRPAVMLLGLDRQALHQFDHLGMTPLTVARQSHRLPCGAGVGQLVATGEAALGIPAYGAGAERSRGLFRAEMIFGDC